MQADLRRTRNSWRAMRSRCNDPKNVSFHGYGAKGIKVCERWSSFDNFLADMGLRPAGTTIDRIDGDGNYEPGNCRWATRPEQNKNRRYKRPIEFRGRSQSMNAWVKELGLGMNTLARRLASGWDRERAFTTPGKKSA